MAIKKSELYSILWESCNTLRSKGSMDATQYKDYVLIILFIKVITDKYYRKKEALIYVPEDANFNTMITLKGKKNIGEECNKIISRIAEENSLTGVIDIVDFNDDSKLGKDKDKIDALTGLIEIFQNKELDFSNNRADDDDLLGDAYEYLMKQFASEAGKSKGQFYTPAEVSRIMAKLIGIDKATKSPLYVYDMTCGSGSLLLKACAEAKDNISVNAYGQEKDGSTAGLAIMNMYLHGNETADIRIGNTLTSPQFLESGRIRQFDYCVANPPFSVKKWNSDMTNDYGRFEGIGMPPEGCADYAFLLHMLKSMDSDHGRGAIILPHGVLFRGGQEEQIRKKLIEKGYIEGIIGLPSNLFYGTGIPACIIILDKKDATNRKTIFMIDASKGFVKDGNKNRLREQDIKKIIDVYLNKESIEKYSRNVTREDIEKEEYNLNIPRYIDSSIEEKEQDIKAHLQGGIPEKDIKKYIKYWQIAPKLREKLFRNNEKDGYLDLAVSEDKVNEIILNSEEMKDYSNKLDKRINKWFENNKDKLSSITYNTRVRDLISKISSNFLELFEEDSLIDKYDAYEYIMEYINETMKDDFYIISDNGWIPELKYGVDKNGNIKKNEFDSDLLPKEIVINVFFYEENKKIEEYNNELNDLISVYDSTVQDNMGDESLFKEDDKVNEKFLKVLFKESENKEKEIIGVLLKNLNDQKDIKRNIKESTDGLNSKIIKKYGELDVNNSKKLIIKNKWFNSINKRIKEQKDNLIYELTNNIIEEYDNYKKTLPELIYETSELEKIVLSDLERMGFKW